MLSEETGIREIFALLTQITFPKVSKVCHTRSYNDDNKLRDCSGVFLEDLGLFFQQLIVISHHISPDGRISGFFWGYTHRPSLFFFTVAQLQN